MQHVFSQFFHVCTAVGDFAPEEHAYLVFVVGATQGMHDFSCQLTAVAVIRVVAVIPVLLCFQGSGGCQLHGTEHTAVDVALYFQYPLHEVGIRGKHADTPSRHVVAFAHGIEFYAALFGTRNTEDADGMFVQDETVGVVVYDDDVLAACEVHQFPVQFRCCVRPGGHIGIVGPHQFYTAHVHPFQFVEVGHPAVFFFQVIVHDLGTQNLA